MKGKGKKMKAGKFLMVLFIAALFVFSLAISFKYAIVSTEYRMYKHMVEVCGVHAVTTPPLETIK